MRRSRTALPILAPVLLLSACVSGTSSDPTDLSPGITTAGARDVSETRVLDGDTFVVDLDGEAIEVRLLGINTPERDECQGSQARTEAIEIVEGARISLTGNEYDQFGRLLAYVFADDVLVNAELVESGLALAQSNDHPRVAEFKDLEEKAYEAGSGLWNPEACPPAADAKVVISELKADAPGPDNENPNGEFVVVKNRGDSTVDLSGWTIRDESSRHRYTFGAFSLAAGEHVTVYSGSGEDTDRDLYWAAGDPVWSNGGDTAYLLDPSGNYRFRLAHIG
ncbi:MAG: hypothetical protein HKO03_04675 [Acidimicrobiia bacterium]|nr:hypothetical protein [Acidimicrobiia bacterium]